jgi:hypothetical protein
MFGSPETSPQIGVGAGQFRGTPAATGPTATWPAAPLFSFGPRS